MAKTNPDEFMDSGEYQRLSNRQQDIIELINQSLYCSASAAGLRERSELIQKALQLIIAEFTNQPV